MTDRSKLQAIYNDLLALQDQTDQVPLTTALDAVGAALRALDEAATPQQRQRIDHPNRPDEADYEYKDLIRRIETLGGPKVVVGILQQYAFAAPRQGSYAGSLWAIAEWVNERLCVDAAQAERESK